MAASNPSTRRFAWNGVSFRTPDDWNLSHFQFDGRCFRVEMEDDYSRRLELECVRPRKKPDLASVQKRYEKTFKRLADLADRTETLEDVPPGWLAFLYTMPSGDRLATAYHLPADSLLFSLLTLHFEGAARSRARATLGGILESFRIHDAGPVPWELYDVAFSLDPGFRLASTSLQAGRKLLVFQWRLRKLYLWFFSLAGMLLKGRTLEDWVVEHLAGFKPISGPRFRAEGPGRISARRAWPFPTIHFTEIGRGCLRYHVAFRHDVERDRIVLGVYNYRWASDLAKFPHELFGAPAQEEVPGP